jgi:enoyl-CoA hydratase/carnithine racemase
MTSYKTILFDRKDAIAYITLNRGEQRNAMSLQLMEEMIAALREIGNDDKVSIVIIRGNGPAFSAGHDIAEMRNKDVKFLRRLFDVCCDLMNTIQRIPQPVIAQVHGVATAAGCQLAAACDLGIASENAWFATPGIKIGFFCSTPAVAVARSVMNRKKVVEMLFTGDPVSAEEAVAIGLINKVVSSEALESEVYRLAEKIMHSSSFVLGLGKQVFYRQMDMSQESAYYYAREVMALNGVTSDAQEGFNAFLEKRKPRWS